MGHSFAAAHSRLKVTYPGKGLFFPLFCQTGQFLLLFSHCSPSHHSTKHHGHAAQQPPAQPLHNALPPRLCPGSDWCLWLCSCEGIHCNVRG